MEIEKKILEINVSELKTCLRALRPRPKNLFNGRLRVAIFDFPDLRIRRKRDLLRLREFIPVHGKSYAEVVYKIYRGVKKGCKYFEELEVESRNKGAFRALEKFFKKLGLTRTLFYEKKRELYAWKNVKLEIDYHRGIPPFMEIEGPSPVAINKTIKLLKLETYEQSSETIFELMRRKYPKVSF